MRIATAVIATLVITLGVVTIASARTWYIRPDGSGDVPTIQTGIDSAAVADTVLLGPGTYTGVGNKDLDFGGKNLILRSEAGPEVTIIDCESVGRGLYLHSGETVAAVVEGLTITNGNVYGGGGIYCRNSSPTISECIFSENSAEGDYEGGGGIFCRECSPKISDCIFSQNRARAEGGGLCCILNSCPAVTNCTFSGNSADWGGGMICDEDCSPAVTNCLFSGNSAAEGGGLECKYSAPTITNCTFSGNSAVYCGGGLCACDWYPVHPPYPKVRQCTFVQNSAGGYGGGVQCGGATVILENTIVALSTQGEGVQCRDRGAASLSCCDVYGNAGGDWVSCITDQYGVNGNFSADPKFCDRRSGNFMLCENSPCAPGHSPSGCGLIGAFPIGCGPTAVEYTTWGKIKSIFR